jgi:hypothetical protein
VTQAPSRCRFCYAAASSLSSPVVKLAWRVALAAMCLAAASVYGSAETAGRSSDATIVQRVATDIEKLKTSFPQLRDFSARTDFNPSVPAITYSFHTHAAEKTGGWTSGVPNPDDDGVWFYIDLHDPKSTLEIHTQPMVTAPMCLGDRRVSYLSLEGRRTKSIGVAIWKILRKYGAHECSGD